MTLKQKENYYIYIFPLYFHIFLYFLVIVHIGYALGQQGALYVFKRSISDVRCRMSYLTDRVRCLRVQVMPRQHRRTVLLLFRQVKWLEIITRGRNMVTWNVTSNGSG